MAKEIKIKIKIPEFGKIISRWFLLVKKYLLIACKTFLSDIKTKKKRGIVALLLSGGAFWLWGLSSALLWLLFLLFLVYEWENRIIAFFALVSLASCPVLLSLKKDAMAEIMAVYAYFFLVMTVALQIVEYKRHPERFPEEEEGEQEIEEVKILKKKKVKYEPINRYVKIGLSVLIIVLVGSGVFSFMNKKESNNKTTENSELFKEREEAAQKEIKKEDVELIVLNGNGLEDAVNNFADDLRKNGFTVKNVGKADNFNYEKTVIEYSSANKAKADYINGVLGGKLELREVGSDSDEITIILGKDYLGIFIWTE